MNVNGLYCLVIIHLMGMVITDDRLLDTGDVILEKEEVFSSKNVHHNQDDLVLQPVETSDRNLDEVVNSKTHVEQLIDEEVDEKESLVTHSEGKLPPNLEHNEANIVNEQDVSPVNDKQSCKNENVLLRENVIAQELDDKSCKSNEDIDNDQDECDVNENLKEHAIIVNNENSASDNIGEKDIDQESPPTEIIPEADTGTSKDSPPPSPSESHDPSSVDQSQTAESDDGGQHTSHQTDDLPEPRSKHRLFPLLYTFRTLFTSFLAEFAGHHTGEDPASNSTSQGDNSTSPQPLQNDGNSTVNGTDSSSKKTRFQCAPKNMSENVTAQVKIVNSTELLEILALSKSSSPQSQCVLVMFYAPWCHFCAATAPHYNALARVFPQLDVLAVDTSHFSYLNARFGTVAVPNIMLFHSRSAVRFNNTARVLENFVDFVTNNTGMQPDANFTLSMSDWDGPLLTSPVKGRDWLLWLAWLFVLACSTVGLVKSHLGQGLINKLGVLWQEHQHQE